jgi:hypothetical protein
MSLTSPASGGTVDAAPTGRYSILEKSGLISKVLLQTRAERLTAKG